MKEHWKFTCTCPRCSDPTEMGTFLSAIRCTECSKAGNIGYLLPADSGEDADWVCCNCGDLVPWATADAFLQELVAKSEVMSFSQPCSAWESLLEELQTKYLHPNHYLCMHVKRILIHLYGNKEKFDANDMAAVSRKLRLCQNYIEVYSKVEEGYSAWRGRLLEEMVGPYLQHHKQALKAQEITESEYLQHFKESLKMIKFAAKCRQFEPTDSRNFIAWCLKEANDALG